MTTAPWQKALKGFRNLPNLLQGYNIYVNRDKFRLIDLAFTKVCPHAKSFADLGGVWNVNAAYTLYTLKTFSIERGVLIDTEFPPGLNEKLRRFPNLEVVRGDFGSQAIVDKVGTVDVVVLFDVLLHQANPDWDEILKAYTQNCSCFIIYNQQYTKGEAAIRLTDLPFKEYIEIVSDHGEELSRFVYNHKDEIHPVFQKPWKDIHNITQWGITDKALRQSMDRLGFREVYFKNYGMFIDLRAFENHAFIFVR